MNVRIKIQTFICIYVDVSKGEKGGIDPREFSPKYKRASLSLLLISGVCINVYICAAALEDIYEFILRLNRKLVNVFGLCGV